MGGGGVTGATIKNSGNIISGIPLAGSVLPPPSKIIKVEYLYYIYVISFMNHQKRFNRYRPIGLDMVITLKKRRIIINKRIIPPPSRKKVW